MAISLTQLQTDLDAILADLPVTLTFQGTTVTGSKSEELRDNVLVDEGKREQYRFSVYCSAADFTTIPDVDDVVTVPKGGTDYFVLDRSRDNPEQMIRLDLGESRASD